MASLAAENWVNYDGIEVSEFDGALLMSLLEESNGEGYNDEQLNRVIQSLEAEINEQNMVEWDDLAMESELLLSDEEDGQNCLASTDFGWADNMELVPSSPSEDMNWSNYMDQCELHLDNLLDFEGVPDYSQINFNVVEAEEQQGFSSLWHETCDGIGYTV
ncbi:putative Heat stress transcription factor B-4b [Melia azedarach]|uniref:Heat stress transcription factor B-4b n=1 Tax=Melia azedarach TaxID=155640 RepID=A0ACC1YU68_MELAZ|nr:putative Heat stress transcription factor B-4b [Melia azedarach]